MLADTSGTVGAVAGSFDLKQLVVQDEGFKSAHINLGDGKTEWLLIANAAETEVTAIRGTGGGGAPENYVLQQPLVIKTYAQGHSLFNTLLEGAKNGRNFAQNKTDQIIDPVYMDVGTLQEAVLFLRLRTLLLSIMSALSSKHQRRCLKLGTAARSVWWRS